MIVVQQAFSQSFNGTLLSFAAGKVIENESLERELLNSSAPVLLVKDASDLIQCPYCRQKFTVSQAVDEEC